MLRALKIPWEIFLKPLAQCTSENTLENPRIPWNAFRQSANYLALCALALAASAAYMNMERRNIESFGAVCPDLLSTFQTFMRIAFVQIQFFEPALVLYFSAHEGWSNVGYKKYCWTLGCTLKTLEFMFTSFHSLFSHLIILKQSLIRC